MKHLLNALRTIAVVSLVGVFVLVACNGDGVTTAGNGTLSLALTDQPACGCVPEGARKDFEFTGS